METRSLLTIEVLPSHLVVRLYNKGQAASTNAMRGLWIHGLIACLGQEVFAWEHVDQVRLQSVLDSSAYTLIACKFKSSAGRGTWNWPFPEADWLVLRF